MNYKNKVILIDWSLFLHKSVFLTTKNIGIPATYTCLNMIFTCLSYLQLTEKDTVIVAMDGRNNWRKQVDPNYKANRKELREQSGINWPYWFREFDTFVLKLKQALPYLFIQIETLEADDIIAVACKYYKDSECIIISSDTDFEQLYSLPNVKIFSPKAKKFKTVDNPYQVLAKKIDKEKTDNLVTEVLDEADFQKRYMLVSLLKLPKEIEEKALDKLQNLEYNDEYDLSFLPFKTLRQKFSDIYFNSRKQKKERKKKCLKLPKKASKERCSNSEKTDGNPPQNGIF